MGKAPFLIAMALMGLMTAPCHATLLAAVLDEGCPATPTPNVGVELLATGGPISIYFAGSAAWYSSDLYLDALGLPGGSQFLFSNHGTAVGHSVAINGVSAGTVLTFRLVVRDPVTDATLYTWRNGPGSGNSDDAIHALVCQWVADEIVAVNGLFIGFEDWPGVPQGDYNDVMFVAVGVTDTPEPSSVPLVGSGLAMLAFAARKCRG